MGKHDFAACDKCSNQTARTYSLVRAFVIRSPQRTIVCFDIHVCKILIF